MTRPAVLGAGSWGTALALVLARRGLDVRLWTHNPELGREMAATRANNCYLPDFALPASITVTGNLADCVAHADTVIFATPSHAVRETAIRARKFLDSEIPLISASKGIEEHSLQRMSQVLSEVCDGHEVVALSGPSFAREVAQELPTALVAASADPVLAQSVQILFSGPRFRVYASSDVCGVEIGGAVKNVIAIAAGVCHGLNLGSNAVAALITRGLAEMSRLAVSLGARAETLSGLAGLGDLALTCNGGLSRNREVGIQLALGRTVESITTGMKTIAEGIRTTNSVVELGRKYAVSLPISEQMHAVLHGRRAPVDAIQSLMERSLRASEF